MSVGEGLVAFLKCVMHFSSLTIWRFGEVSRPTASIEEVLLFNQHKQVVNKV